MFMKKPTHRVFEYIPRFYNPLSDDKERKKRKLGFKAQRRKLRQRKNPLLWIILIIIIVYLYLKLSSY